MNKHPLKEMIKFQKNKQAVGIYSACSANEIVLEACMEKARDTASLLLIEATSNQVDQYGGYTGMTPNDFYNFVHALAKKVKLDENQIILGGDHLGPLTFTSLNEVEAMKEASELVYQYVMASFTKIHIDTSMKLADDSPVERLSDRTIARRGAMLVKVAEEAYQALLKIKPDATHPVYIVGSEVPIPGGSQDINDMGVQVTKVSDFKATISAFVDAFKEAGISDAWQYVIAAVVQPGVEEKDAGCTEYDRQKAADLMHSIDEFDDLVFEGHSTDYQTKIKLKELVEDGVGILKVGPGLSFAAREGLFALANIEKELYKQSNTVQSNFIELLDEAMINEPKYWLKHYHGNSQEIALKRKYSFSDRSRYYMPFPALIASKERLFDNLKNGIPLNLLSQFMPVQYTKVREGLLKNEPYELVKDRIKNTVDEYLYATNQSKLPF